MVSLAGMATPADGNIKTVAENEVFDNISFVISYIHNINFVISYKIISYIHNFIFIFPGYITNQFNDQVPVGLLAQLVRALHRYRRGQGSNPGKPDFFRLSFRNCISCVNNCEDLLYIDFFIPQFKYMNFIYS